MKKIYRHNYLFKKNHNSIYDNCWNVGHDLEAPNTYINVTSNELKNSLESFHRTILREKYIFLKQNHIRCGLWTHMNQSLGHKASIWVKSYRRDVGSVPSPLVVLSKNEYPSYISKIKLKRNIPISLIYLFLPKKSLIRLYLFSNHFVIFLDSSFLIYFHGRCS